MGLVTSRLAVLPAQAKPYGATPYQPPSQPSPRVGFASRRTRAPSLRYPSFSERRLGCAKTNASRAVATSSLSGVTSSETGAEGAGTVGAETAARTGSGSATVRGTGAETRAAGAGLVAASEGSPGLGD